MPSFNTRKLKTSLHDLGKAVNVITTGRWMLYCIIIGALAGLAALLFSYCLDIMHDLLISDAAGMQLLKPAGEHMLFNTQLPRRLINAVTFHQHWLIIVLPAFGGLVSGYLVFKFAPEAEGHGTDAVIRSFHHNKGYIRPIVPFIKLIASVFTIGTGGSAGKEGPIAQIGAGMASYIGTKLNMSEQERKIMLMAGLGAGIGAIFKAPIGGALFAAEVFYRKDFQSEGLVASIIASIIGYSVYASFDGWEPIFTFQPISFSTPYELPLFILLALIVMIGGITYTKIFYGTKDLFDKLDIPKYLKPAIGGLLVGIIAFFVPSVIGSSYGYLQAALNGNLAISFMLVLLVVKIFATSLTINTGGSGGVFAPSLVIGGLLGGAFGYGIEMMYPGTLASPEAYVLVGMGAFFAGAANVPVSSTILISEMSKSYGLIVPLIFASAIAYLGAQNWSIYREQIEDRHASSSYRGAFLQDVLQSVKVRNAYQPIKDPPKLKQSCNVHQILEAFGQSGTLVLPVEDDQQNIVGMVSLYDARNVLTQDTHNFIIAADLMVPPEFLRMNDPLSKAFQFFKKTGEPELLVKRHGSKNSFMGVLSEREFLLAYERAITGHKKA